MFSQNALDLLKNIQLKPDLSFSDSATFTTTNAITNSSQQILAANPNRKGIMIYNNSSNSVYITLQGPASGTGCHLILAAFATWFSPGPVIWRGPLYAIRNAGSGALNIVEFL